MTQFTTNERLVSAGQKLAQAWKVAGVIEGLDSAELPKTRADAYAIADAMAEAIAEPITG